MKKKNLNKKIDEMVIVYNVPLNYLESFLTEVREETISEIMNIELAPDVKTLETVEGCTSKFEAFGYGQGWVFRKIETLQSLKDK